MSSSTQLCKRCNKLFEYAGFGHVYCSACKEKDEEDFRKVREYLYSHGSASMIEIAAATEVERKYIKQYLREGRLMIPDSSPIFIKCELCGSDIRTGRYCADCAMRLSKDLKSAMVIDEAGEKPSGQMRFLNKTRRKK